MIKAKLSKNGMITLPAKIRERLGIQVGDEVGFIELSVGFQIVPVMKMSQLTNSEHFDSTKELIEEMRIDRSKE